MSWPASGQLYYHARWVPGHSGHMPAGLVRLVALPAGCMSSGGTAVQLVQQYSRYSSTAGTAYTRAQPMRAGCTRCIYSRYSRNIDVLDVYTASTAKIVDVLDVYTAGTAEIQQGTAQYSPHA